MKPKLLPVLSVCLALLPGCAMEKTPPVGGRPASPPAVASPPRDLTSLIARAAQAPLATWPGEGWQPLFDGVSLAGWRKPDFENPGLIEWRDGLLLFHRGEPFTGLTRTNPTPRMNYEVALEAMRVEGTDFFCGLTVPVGESFCSLIVGGWGGGLVGISSLDGLDASENETTKMLNFDTGRWYRIRLRVTEQKIEAWLDDARVVNLDTRGHRLAVRVGEIENSQPFGVASWQTTAALRNMKIRNVTGPDTPLKAR